jgi:serine/threonine protein kinase/WD40 repeat protein
VAEDGRPDRRDEDAASRERRIAEVVARCADRLNAGEPVDIEKVLLEHPDLSAELRSDLEDLLVLRSDLKDRGARDPPAKGSALESLRDRTGKMDSVLLRDLLDDDKVIAGPQRVPGRPRTVEGYQLLGLIAEGGIGTVMKGRDADLNRDVALKLLRSSHEKDPRMVRRFIEEAQIQGQLQHPGIAPVYHLGIFPDRRPFFAMKLVKGRTLAALLEEREGPTREQRRFLGIFEQVCHTMAYAHARGVIHRDLKPSNIMVGAFGEVQVMDWGLAKVLACGGVADEVKSARSLEEEEDAEVQTVRSGTPDARSQAGQVLGTPSYMSPEQARGEVEDLDERTDVFGLGAILCEVLTGRPPFVASIREGVTRKARQGDLEEAFGRLEGCGADPEIVRIARSCLAPARSDRPRDAGVVAKEVGAFLASAEERTRRAELGAAEAKVKAAEERKRRKVTLVLGGSVAVLLLALAVGSLITSASMREKLWEAYLAHGQASRWSGRPGQRFDGLDALEKAARIRPTIELRNEAISCMALVDVRKISAFPMDKPYNPAFDHGLERYALYEGEQRDIRIHRTSDGREVLRLEGSLPIMADSVAFSPDGRRIASIVRDATGAKLQVWDLERRQVIPSIGGVVRSYDFSPDGRQIAVIGEGRVLELHDIEKPDSVRKVPLARGPKIIKFHPGGGKLALSYDGPGIDVLSVPAGEIQQSLDSSKMTMIIAWSPDGRFLATNGTLFPLAIWDFLSGKQKQLEGHESAVVDLWFSPRSDLLASVSWDGTWRLWNPFSGRQLLVSSRRAGPFSPDGLGMAYSAETKTGVLEVASADAFRMVPVAGICHWIDALPGTRLAAISTEKAICLWDLSSDRELASIPLGGSQAFFLGGDELVGFHRSGLFRFPIRRSETDPGFLSIGPPSLVDDRNKLLNPSPARKGKRVAFVCEGQYRGIVRELGSRIARTWPVFRARMVDVFIAMSTDGELAATSGEETKVWGVSSMKSIADLPAFSVRSIVFSPDGRRLAMGGFMEYAVWEVGTWRRVGTWKKSSIQPIAVSASDSLLAIAATHTHVDLIGLSTGSSLATLDATDSVTINRLLFSGDGGRLLADSPNGGPIHVWDLRKTRSTLSRMGLDWEGPPIGPDDPLTYRIELDLSGLDDLLRYQDLVSRAGSLLREKSDDKGAFIALREALSISPNGVNALLTLAEVYAKQGNLGGSIEQIGKALEVDPDAEVPGLLVDFLKDKGEDQAPAASLLRRILDRRR